VELQSAAALYMYWAGNLASTKCEVRHHEFPSISVSHRRTSIIVLPQTDEMFRRICSHELLLNNATH